MRWTEQGSWPLFTVVNAKGERRRGTECEMAGQEMVGQCKRMEPDCKRASEGVCMIGRLDVGEGEDLTACCVERNGRVRQRKQVARKDQSKAGKGTSQSSQEA